MPEQNMDADSLDSVSRPVPLPERMIDVRTQEAAEQALRRSAFATRELGGRCEMRFPPEGAEHVLEFPVAGRT